VCGVVHWSYFSISYYKLQICESTRKDGMIAVLKRFLLAM